MKILKTLLCMAIVATSLPPAAMALTPAQMQQKVADMQRAVNAAAAGLAAKKAAGGAGSIRR